MSLLFKELFEVFTSNLVVSDNLYVNAIFISIIGYIAYKLAYYIVSELGIENIIGSFFHWFIRFIIFLTLSKMANFIFRVIRIFIALQLIYKIFFILVLVIFLVLIFIRKIKKFNYN